MKTWQRSLMAAFALLALFGGVAYAQAPGAPPVEFPYTGNRTAVWIVAQLHILFAGFILGAPIFVVISEWLGYRKQDPRYDRLAKEVTKVTVILYSMTALTGETGAGKTMLVEAISLLLGATADPAVVRHGAEAASVEGRFVDGDTELVLARVVPADGRSRAYVDGGLATAATLTPRRRAAPEKLELSAAAAK